jgi:hypothetical protein
VRTHAYAVRGRFLRVLAEAFSRAKNHCDWVLAGLQPDFECYAPSPFVCGQEEQGLRIGFQA